MKSLSIAFIFPWPREKEAVRHPEHIASGGCWSLIHALRLSGHRVFPVNLYDEQNQINGRFGEEQYRRGLNSIRFDAAVVFDTGQAKVDWKQIATEEHQDFPTIYHAGDDPMRHDANVDALGAGSFDGILCAQLPFKEKYKDKFKVPVEWMPYHHDGLLHYPVAGNLKQFDIVHCGKVYGLREPLLKAFSGAGLKVHCADAWGHAYRASLTSAKVGWHHAWCGEVGYRHFELPAMGQLLICDELEAEYGLGELYQSDAIVTYSGKDDKEKIESAVGKVKHYAENVSERNAIANRGRDISLTEHGPLRRAEQLANFIQNNFGG